MNKKETRRKIEKVAMDMICLFIMIAAFLIAADLLYPYIVSFYKGMELKEIVAITISIIIIIVIGVAQIAPTDKE